VLEFLDAGSNGRGHLLKDRVHDRGRLSTAIRTVTAGGSATWPTPMT
jgi:hypothetical protein